MKAGEVRGFRFKVEVVVDSGEIVFTEGLKKQNGYE